MIIIEFLGNACLLGRSHKFPRRRDPKLRQVGSTPNRRRQSLLWSVGDQLAEALFELVQTVTFRGGNREDLYLRKAVLEEA